MVGSSTKTTAADHLQNHRHHHHHHHHQQQQQHHSLMDDGDENDLSSASSAAAVPCSICLDLVLDNGSRSTAKLQCGHEFHLDCIGSAFNVKGAMQCPNCRKVEKGQWLYANGSTRPFHELSMDDWIPDEDFYDLNYPEMPYEVHWCPFGELARVGSFEEVESPSSTYHDLRGHRSLYGEHPAASAVAHSYIAYLGPIPPASSRSNDSVDDPNFNHHWNGLSGRNEVFSAHTLPAMNIQYHSWGRHSPPFSISSSNLNSADPSSAPSLALRSSNSDSDSRTRSTSFPHPILFGPGSVPTAGSSFVSSIVPRHPSSSARTHERIHISHPFPHQQLPSNSPGMTTPIIHGNRRFDGPRGLPTLVPASPQHDHSGGFFMIPSGSSGQNLREAESPLLNRTLAWDREQISHIPHVAFGRDPVWGSFQQSGGASDSGNRSSSSWRRNSS